MGISYGKAKLTTENGMDVIQVVDVKLGKERPTALDSRNVYRGILAVDVVHLRCNHEDFVEETSNSVLFVEIQPAT